jgi:hypothetical protein
MSRFCNKAPEIAPDEGRPSIGDLRKKIRT